MAAVFMGKGFFIAAPFAGIIAVGGGAFCTGAAVLFRALFFLRFFDIAISP